MERAASAERSTNETHIHVAVDLDGRGQIAIKTGVPFFDHMLEQLGRHSGIDIEIDARGDLEVDSHHTVEDVGIVLGEALTKALGAKKGIRRYGAALVPMEEALSQVALDLSGRPFLSFEVSVPAEKVGNYDPDLTEEFFTALSRSAGMTLHIKLLSGKNSHHIIESVFKGVARALAEAIEIDPRRSDEIPSTKGTL